VRCPLGVVFWHGFCHTLRIPFDASEPRSVGFLRFVFYAYLHDVTSQTLLPAKFGTGLAVAELSNIEQLCTVSRSTKYSIQSWNNRWTIEDEQCQKVGGGYAALKRRFLLFLRVEPTFIYADLESSRIRRRPLRARQSKPTRVDNWAD